jgi:hypothetical protein
MADAISLGKVAPLTPIIGVDPNDPTAATYQKAIQEGMETLKARMNPQFNWGKLGEALLKPTRGGSAFESIGNASGAIGEEQERQEKEAVPISQMRVALAGQDYQMKQEAQALASVANIIKVKPADVMGALQNSNLYDPKILNKLMEIYPSAARSPKVGPIVKEMIDQGFKLQAQLTDERKAGTPEAALYAKHGAKILPFLSPEFRTSIAPATSSAATAPVSTTGPIVASGPARPEPLATDLVPMGTSEFTELGDADARREQNNTPRGPVARAPVTAPAKTEARTDGYIGVDGKFKPFPPNASFELQDELIKQNEKAIIDVQKTQAEADSKYWGDQKTMIYTNGMPDVITRQKNDLDIIGNASIDHPQVLGQLAKEGLFNALANALDTGAQAGRFGTFSLPVDQFISQIALNDPDRAIKISVAKSMARVFFDNAQLAKSVLGRFTDQDARLAQAPLASMSDPAKTVQHWVGEQLVNLEHKKNSYNAMNKWEDDNPGVSTRKFFSPSNPEYMRIIAEHQTRLAHWLATSPLYKTGAK